MAAIVNAVRKLVALATVVAGAYAFYAFCLLPYRCNRLKNALIRPSERAFQRAGTPEGSIAARQNLAALQECMRASCRDVSLDMIAAANYRVISRNQEAIALYRDALRLDRRPEIYLNLAATEIAAGDRSGARVEMVRAAMFNPWMIGAIDDGLLRREVVNEVIARRPENADFIRYVDALPP